VDEVYEKIFHRVLEAKAYGRPLLPVSVYTSRLQTMRGKLWTIRRIWERITRG
jgi:hypothetical protein